jgi:uncharacterized protein
MKPIHWRRSWAGKYLRHVPRIKHLPGTFLHRTLGDRFFDPRLWRWDRHGTALGLAIGAFFSVLPFPLQSIPAALGAVLARVNVPGALVGCWITNPFTFPFFIYAQLKLGSLLLGRPSLADQLHDLMQRLTFWELVKQAPGIWGVLMLGGIALGAIVAVVCYFGVALGFDVALRLLARSRATRPAVRR